MLVPGCHNRSTYNLSVWWYRQTRVSAIRRFETGRLRVDQPVCNIDNCIEIRDCRGDMCTVGLAGATF